MTTPFLPPKIRLGQEEYVATVFLIHTKYEDGTPAICKLIKDDRTINLAQGDEFFINFVSKKMIK